MDQITTTTEPFFSTKKSCAKFCFYLRNPFILFLTKNWPNYQLKSKLKNGPNHQYYRALFFSTKKLREIFLLEKFPIYFFLNIPKDVFKSLLRGRETIKKKYREVLEKFPKNMVFWTSKWPVHPSVRPSIRQYKKLYP